MLIMCFRKLFIHFLCGYIKYVHMLSDCLIDWLLLLLLLLLLLSCCCFCFMIIIIFLIIIIMFMLNYCVLFAGILLHEMTKLLYYANATDVRYIRMGTCGGLKLPPGKSDRT
jgi:hypothetical protein